MKNFYKIYKDNNYFFIFQYYTEIKNVKYYKGFSYKEIDNQIGYIGWNIFDENYFVKLKQNCTFQSFNEYWIRPSQINYHIYFNSVKHEKEVYYFLKIIKRRKNE